MLVLPAWYPTARQPLLGPYVRDHARAAAEFGHRMVIVVDEGPSGNVRGLSSLAEEQDGPLRIFRLSYRPRGGTLAYLPAVLRVARRLAREGTPVDVLHAHVHRMGWAAVLAGGLLRRPVVITEHSSEWPQRTMTPGALRRARIAFPRAALVCPVSEYLQRAIEAYGIRARFRVVPNTVDTSVFHPASTGCARPPASLINVGLQIELKGLDVLLRAFARTVVRRPELTLELVGDGPAGAELQRLAKSLGVDDRVSFSGPAGRHRVGEALRGSDLFVLSSLMETGPVVVLEALCCGLPVVSTRVGSVPKAVGADGELAEPGDVEGLADAIERALDSYARFDRASIAERAASRSSLAAVGRSWDEVYRSVGTRHSPSR